MVNRKNGEYSPAPVYDRKLIRSILKHQIVKKNGQHNVNGYMSAAFKELKGGKE